MMAAIVVPVGDCSIAMTRACFERGSAFWVLGPSADCGTGFVALTDNDDFASDDFASDGFFADFDIEILHSAHDGVTPHHRSPASANKPAGQDLGAPLAPKSADSTAPIATECQSFLPPIQRYLIAESCKEGHHARSEPSNRFCGSMRADL